MAVGFLDGRDIYISIDSVHDKPLFTLSLCIPRRATWYLEVPQQ